MSKKLNKVKKNGPLNRSGWQIIKDIINGKKAKKNTKQAMQSIRECTDKIREVNERMDQV